MNVMEIRDLCKSYGSFHLDSLNLTLPSGCIMGLVGENGAGKSTTIKLILNAIRKDRGEITVFGKDSVKDSLSIKEDVGVVLDEVGFPEYVTVDHVDRMMQGIFSHWDSECFYAYIRRLSVPTDKRFKEFSRGMKMKLGIAVALSHGARLLILDEATSGLDPVVRDTVLDILCEFTRDERNSVLISSHIVSDLEKICDYIAFLHNGKLMLCKEKDRLKEDYVLVRCKAEELDTLAKTSLIGKRETPFGVEAIVRRGAANPSWETGVLDLEQLFVFMAKEVR